MDDLQIQIAEAPISSVAELMRVPIAFEVDRVFDVDHDGGSGRFLLSERPLDVPYVKDYDAIAVNGPDQLAARFDVSCWGLLVARAAGELVGGAVIAFDTPGVDMLEGRRDLAVLWDIRVAPEVRGRGVGAALFRAAGAWARERGCRALKVETQNVNVPACRFYATMGCDLRSIDRTAYPELPGEIQMLWWKELST